jgi:hypothetical protein
VYEKCGFLDFNTAARSRAVGRKLKDVQELPVGETTTLLPSSVMEDDGEADEGDSGDGD